MAGASKVDLTRLETAMGLGLQNRASGQVVAWWDLLYATLGVFESERMRNVTDQLSSTY
jgi:hypothetical protein